VKVENIRHGLRTFDTSYYQAPGRMNVYDDHPFKVILDYGHNPAAVQAMADLVGKLTVEGRRICVLAGPGDRRDEDLREMARIAAGAFDFVILRRDDDLRGRGSDDVPKLMAREMLEHGFPEDRLRIIPDEQEAVESGLALARRGDLLLIFADKVSRSWKQVIYFKRPPEPEPVEAPPPPAGPIAAEVSTGPLPEAWIQDARGVRLARESED
jgi:cyanophycin synthetase